MITYIDGAEDVMDVLVARFHPSVFRMWATDIAAYFGGRLDTFIMRFVDLMLGFPTILVALMILVVFGQGTWKVILALVIVQWAYFARAVRGTALVEAGQKKFVGGRRPRLTPLPAGRRHPETAATASRPAGTLAW